MALELWALANPFSNGALDGVLLARAEIGQVSGQRSVGPLQYSVPLSWPPAGLWRIALLLREWTAAGFLTRDSRNFSVPFDNASAASPEVPAASLVARPDETYAKPELLGPPLPRRRRRRTTRSRSPRTIAISLAGALQGKTFTTGWRQSVACFVR
jgi:hypothetical protein